MRITNSMMVSNYMNNLTTNLNKLDKLTGQLATNRKWAHISDDPISVIYSQQARQKLRKLSQYQSNVETSQEWLTQVETSVMDLNKVVTSAYESCIDAATDVKGAPDKTNASVYIRELRDQVLTTLNSTFGDKYLFGGYNTTGHINADGKLEPPFTADTETYIDENGIERERSFLLFNGVRLNNNPNTAEVDQIKQIMGDVLTFDVGLSVDMQVTVPGVQVVGLESYDTVEYAYASVIDADPPPHGTPDPASQLKDANGALLFDSKGNPVYETVPTQVKRESNIFELLDSLYRAAEDSDRQLYPDPDNPDAVGIPPEDQPMSGADLINSFIPYLQSAQSSVLTMVADIGGRTSRLDLMASRYEQDELNYTKMKSDAEDMDQAEIIMNYKMAESVYKAALSTGSYIIQPTLMDFLR